MIQLPNAGAASAELRQEVHQVWLEAIDNAKKIDLTGFNPNAPLDERLAWAKSRGLEIGTVLSRFSTKLQKSTTSQVLDCVRFAASKQIYVPPEFVCVDEAVTGRKLRRAGVERVKLILKNLLARVLLVFKVSRLFRSAYRGTQFIVEEIVDSGLRAVSVSQGVDTSQDNWRPQMALHGIMDELILSTLADHVRSGQKDLFRQGYVTGAIPVGYRREEVPGAPLTNKKLPRTRPRVDAEVAKMIVQHYEWIRDGMPIKEGWRRWVRAGGSFDKRSTVRRMTYQAYRRMLSNARYTGRWKFGTTRNKWNSKLDYNLKVAGPADEIVEIQLEELRIVSDELFLAVQQRLAEKRTTPRPRKTTVRTRQLWDLVTDCFYCSTCQERYYQAGAHGDGMTCKRGDICPCKVIVKRQDAVGAVCLKLTELLQANGAITEETIIRAREMDAAGDAAARDQLGDLAKKLAALERKILDLTDLAGEGTDDERNLLKAKIRTVQQERRTLQMEQAQLQSRLQRSSEPITPDQVRVILNDLTKLLEDGASGQLGDDAVYRSAEVFRQLVGGRVEVCVERRPNRTRANVAGVFQPRHLATVGQTLDVQVGGAAHAPSNVRVWLREPPRCDQLAELVHQLIDEQGHSFRSAAKVLQAMGHNINSGVVWQLYRRYYEMIGQPMPNRPYNNGIPREPRS